MLLLYHRGAEWEMYRADSDVGAGESMGGDQRRVLWDVIVFSMTGGATAPSCRTEVGRSQSIGKPIWNEIVHYGVWNSSLFPPPCWFLLERCVMSTCVIHCQNFWTLSQRFSGTLTVAKYSVHTTCSWRNYREKKSVQGCKQMTAVSSARSRKNKTIAQKKVPEGVEPSLAESESAVITVRPWNRVWCWSG